MATYADPFVRADPQGLTITWYYFPLGKSYTVAWDRVVGVAVHDNTSVMSTKSWGSTFDLSIWWACDMGRPFKKLGSQLVLSVKGEGKDETDWHKKGFSCDDPALLMAAINSLRAKFLKSKREAEANKGSGL